MTPAVDVVIPLYDKARVLGRAIDGVLAQTVADWRLTIVDDGSSDDVAEVLAAYADEPRIRVVRQENAGPGSARNHGLRLADAEWVSFLDADDEWLPEFLERQLAVLAEHPGAVASASSWFHDRGRRDTHALRTEHALVGEWAWTPEAGHLEMRRRVDAFHSSAVVVRREVVARLGGYYDRARCLYGEDSYLWLQVLVSHPVVLTEDRLLRFHSDASTLSVGRTAPYPLPPSLTDARTLLAAVPDAAREWMRGYLVWYADFIVRRSVRERAFGQARRVGRILESELDVTGARARSTVRRGFVEVLKDKLERSRGFGERAGTA